MEIRNAQEQKKYFLKKFDTLKYIIYKIEKTFFIKKRLKLSQENYITLYLRS